MGKVLKPKFPLRKEKSAKRSQPNATLRERMLADLKRSGLTPQDADALGCTPVSGVKAKRLLKLSKVNLSDGYIIPYHDAANGNLVAGVFRWRSLGEYKQRNRQTGKQEAGPKYRQPSRTEPWVYQSPLGIDWAEVKGPVVITEGEKKSACACKVGIPTVGLGGVWNWKKPKSDDQLLPDFEDSLCDSENVEICFDSDVKTNANVELALIRLCAALEKSGRNVQVVYLPHGENDTKIGLDDFLVDAGLKPDGKFDTKRAHRAFEKLRRHDVPEPDTGEKMLTDMGAARRLAIANEGTLVYVHELGKFFHRVKHKHWQKNPGIEYVLAKKAARALQKQVPKIKELRLQESTSKFAIRSQSRLVDQANCLNALAQTEPEIAKQH